MLSMERRFIEGKVASFVSNRGVEKADWDKGAHTFGKPVPTNRVPQRGSRRQPTVFA